VGYGMAYERYPIECPSFTEENEKKYADILNGTSYTECFISPTYYYFIHFGGRGLSTMSSLGIMETDGAVLIHGELVTEPKNEEEVVEGIRSIKTRYANRLEESPCAVTLKHRHKVEGREVSHIHFICSTESLLHRSENMERILRGIRKIADKYAIRE